MKEEELKVWKTRIQRAEGLQQKQHKLWKTALDLVNCDYDMKNNPADTETVEVNFASWYYYNLIPLTYFKNPWIYLKSKIDKYNRFAETLETALNAKWQDLDLKQQFQDVIGSALVMPPGWIKVGYTAKIGQDVGKYEENKEKGIITTIKEAIVGIFKEKKEEKLPEEQGILDTNIKEESVFAVWVPSWNMLMPEGYHRIHQMPWLCEWEDIPMIDFISNPFYKNKENVKGMREINSGKEFGGGEALSKVTFNNDSGYSEYNDFEVIRLYHIWDRRTRKRFTFSMLTDKPHFEGDWPYDIIGFPYSPLIFDKKLPTLQNDTPYPINFIKSILPQVLETSSSRTQMSKWRKRSSAIIIAQKGLLTEDDMKQLEDTEAVQIAYVSNKDAVVMTQTPALPNGIFDVDAIIKEDLQMATNMGQMMFAPQKGTRTATQAQIGSQGLQLKIAAKQDAVEDLTVIVARNLAHLMWQFYDRKQVEELIGEEVSEEMWPSLPEVENERRRVIQQMQIRIDAGSAAPPKDDTVDKKQTLDMISILANVMPERLNKGEVGKRILKKFKFSKEDDKMIYTNDDDEQKAAEEENQFLLANHPQIVSPNTNHAIHLQIHAKIAGKTAAGDQHILDHSKFMGINTGGDKGGGGGETSGGNQQGDVRPPMKSSNPEIVRKGIPTGGDQMQAAQNAGPGTSGAPRG